MSRDERILVFAGSTRQGSLNRCLAATAANVAAQMGEPVTLLDLAEYPLPLYERTLATTRGIPRNAMMLRAQLKKHSVVLIASPEHNGSVPTLLKNVIDWVSCSLAADSDSGYFKDKTVGLMCASRDRNPQGGIAHLRQILTHLQANVVAHEFVLKNSEQLFDKTGALRDASHRQALRDFVIGVSDATVDLPLPQVTSLFALKNIARQWLPVSQR